MNIDIQIGSPRLAIHQGEAVWLAETDGQVPSGGEHGLMFRDTRLISVWQLYANFEVWETLNGGSPTHFAMESFLANPAIPTQDGEIPKRSLLMRLGRWMEGGVHEDIDIVNHGMTRATFSLDLVLRSDFADLFEVKSNRLVRRGKITTEWSDDAQQLTMLYRNGDFLRGLTMTARANSKAASANGRISFDVDLAPGEGWHACLLTDLHDGTETLPGPGACTHDLHASASAKSVAAWRASMTKIATSNEEFYRYYHQAVDDLAALRLQSTRADGLAVMPAAGLPWFAALFGRDSLIVALQ
jgi:glycogen debranching enzyme